MNFSVPCECGKAMTISEGLAGAQVSCGCGRLVNVPSLTQLRTDAGLRPVEVPLNVEIDWLVQSGELPTALCIGCHAMGADVVEIYAACERIYVQKSGGVGWGLIILTVVLSGGRLFAWTEEEAVEHGRETVVRVPCRVCDSCRHQLLPPTAKWLPRLATMFLVLGLVGLFIAHWALPAALFLGWLLIGLRIGNQRTQQQRQLKKAMSVVPIYEKLFAKFPGTVVSTDGTVS